MNLLTRPLGKSGLEITQIGFGAWAIGGGGWAYGWGSQDDAQSIAAIKHAVASGINWVDTAAIYGLGHSEEVVGKAVRDIPAAERPYVFTKGGMIPDRSQPYKEPVRDLRPESIRKEVEASLHRLGVERIDLYQFHWPDAIGTPIEESWGEMVRLIDEGKVRAGGVSNFDVGLLWRAERVRHVDSLQPPFSLIHRQSGADVIPWSAAHGTGVIVYSPMQSGILTDGFSRARVEDMAADDWRRRNGEFQEPALSRNLALRDALRPIASRHGVSIAAVAVAWTLSWPGVSGAIVGARSPQQVDGWISAGNLILQADDLAEIAAALERTQAGAGPRQPAGGSDGRDTWLEHGLDPSSLEGAIARMVLPVN
ncbi:MAG: aldo/keto reductase [Chloroflexi bacterium]|nr:MAG: aldo/keto reductase [Chloroflexota bacterium]